MDPKSLSRKEGLGGCCIVGIRWLFYVLNVRMTMGGEDELRGHGSERDWIFLMISSKL